MTKAHHKRVRDFSKTHFYTYTHTHTHTHLHHFQKHTILQIKNFAAKHDMNKDKRRAAYFRAMCKSLKKNVETLPVSLRRIASTSPRTETNTFGDIMTNLMPPALRSHLSREGTSIFNNAITRKQRNKGPQRQRSAPARF